MRVIKGERTFATAIEEAREQPVEQRFALLEPFLRVRSSGDRRTWRRTVGSSACTPCGKSRT
jgi:hypothetical protein